jgi:osmotically-inducible protein OsmY
MRRKIKDVHFEDEIPTTPLQEVYQNKIDTSKMGRGQYDDWKYHHGFSSHFGKGPKGYNRSDDLIYEDACELLKMSPDVDASDIEVKVKDRIIYLTGFIQDRECKRMAEIEIENISGVIDVQNQLVIKKQGQLH